ncbi:unannotated protein [freshwater metagenome]|uniref:Unannotated protein n=1 Tax=freshwater metagenome TaxID=449393 RepID=A0A6J6IKE2_9ZZZZ
MLHTKALFLVNDHEPQVLEGNFRGEQPMRPNNDIDRAVSQSRDHGSSFTFVLKPR